MHTSRRPRAQRKPAPACIAAPPRRAGYTLVEMMVVVAIVGILSALAVPAFSSYIYRSRTSEAINFLGQIKLRQEAFRSEFGQYCNIANFEPAQVPGGDPVQWAPANAGPVINPNNCNWAALGARPDGFVRFRYRTQAGTPANAPQELGYNPNNADFWFVSRAEGDLDGDGETVIFESYSESSSLWCDKPGGWD